MADSRALEEQSERMNPVQPLKKTARRGRTSLVLDAPEYVGSGRGTSPLVGRGATPSIGLSQFRGGARRKPRSESPSEDLSGGAIIGAGKGASPCDMGKALSVHIHKLHGAGFFDDFKKGFLSVVRPVAGIAAMMPGPVGAVGKVASSLMGGVGGPGYEAVSGGVRTGRYEGKGKLLIQHLPEGEGEEIMAGGARKKTRRPAGPDDGRKKRAMVVKKVMAEKGLSMIEASKYVKAHGLY